MIKKVKLLLLILLVAALFSGCTITHKYDAYHGKVIDAETKQPIEGAAVLIVYRTQQFGLAGSVSQFADAQETLTDKNGEFRIPPIRINKFRVLSGWEGHPEVRIVKPGYGCYPMHKDVKPVFEYGSLPVNQYVTIELPQLKTKEERLRNISCFPVGVPDKEMKKIIELDDFERTNLGLEPRYMKRVKK
jgi:hypothetical protein